MLATHGCGTAMLPAMRGAVKSSEPRPVQLYLPEASGLIVFTREGVTLDASNSARGYIMIKSEPKEMRLKLRISHEDMHYVYDLPSDDSYVSVPCQMGSGVYTVRVMEHVQDNLYAQLFVQEINVQIEVSTDPFLYASQYVRFDGSSVVVVQSYLLAEGLSEDADIVQKLYQFVVKNTVYDHEKAATVQKGYLPDPDETLASGKGICFDYAALLASLLRAQGIPTQLVIGIVMPEGITHAWNRTHIKGTWVWMDATLDSTGHKESDYFEERVY